MFQVVKSEPSYFISAKNKVALPLVSGAWRDSYVASIREQLREDMLSNEQNKCCVYCEKEIDSTSEKSNIDHFKTRNLFPEFTLVYDNLLVSCNTNDSCSSSKDKMIKNKTEYDNIINPIAENPHEYFDYLTTGEIISKTGCDKSKFTIEIFKLNHPSLVASRKQVSVALQSLDMALQDILDIFNDYHSFIEVVYPKIRSSA